MPSLRTFFMQAVVVLLLTVGFNFWRYVTVFENVVANSGSDSPAITAVQNPLPSERKSVSDQPKISAQPGGGANPGSSPSGKSMFLGLSDWSVSATDSSFNHTYGEKLHRHLLQETGLRRLIHMIDVLLFPNSSVSCLDTRVGINSEDRHQAVVTRLIPQILGADPRMLSFEEAFSAKELDHMFQAFGFGERITHCASHSRPAFPLISGDGFKYIADFQCDTKPNQRDNCDFDPSVITNRSIIFVNTHNVEHLVNKLPGINAHFFVITHNRDRAAKQDERGLQTLASYILATRPSLK